MEKEKMDLLDNWYGLNYQKKIKGRRITLENIRHLLEDLSTKLKLDKIGKSHLKNDIYSISIGSGKKKILIWSQMHGNESTGTKALFDLFEFFHKKHPLSYLTDQILENCTLMCIPILNPDGAIAYTRVNAQNIDLNRDVVDKHAIESVILQKKLKEFNPQYCFNLHDQRTIFSVGKENNPATISFLSPSIDEPRTITEGRKETMGVIVSMYRFLQNYIPKQIGRYTDEFYPTATGDNFQKMGHNTILIESGHFKDDYIREKTRKYTFYALIQGIHYIASNDKKSDPEIYFDIPNNEKNYLDIILKNVLYQNKKVDIGILFQEKLIDNTIKFIPSIEKIGDLSNFNANKIHSNLDLSFSDKNKLSKWVENEFY